VVEGVDRDCVVCLVTRQKCEAWMVGIGILAIPGEHAAFSVLAGYFFLEIDRCRPGLFVLGRFGLKGLWKAGVWYRYVRLLRVHPTV